ncbi:MAG: hypothetical protein AAF499_08915 [Pseudomonadota bacterium]
MDNSAAQLDALRDLSTGRWLVVIGFVLVHIAAYALFVGIQPELGAVFGIIGLGCYRHGARQKHQARTVLLASVNANRLIA